jgi:translocation and assembly module TamB
MMLGGSGISGSLDFSPSGQSQQIEAHIKARDARLEGPPLLIARRGQFDGIIRLASSGTEIDGTVTGQGLARGGISLARLAANMKLKGGIGEIRASFAGSRGRSFDFQTIAQIAPNRVQIIGSGNVDRKPIRFNSPAILSRESGGWRMAPTALVFGGGQAKVGGLFGGPYLEVDATVDQMPLTILDIFYPRLDLGGIASGAVVLRQPTGGVPTGSANLSIKGLTRSGLVLSSRPVDVGLNAVLSSNNAAARVVAVSGGQIIGRGQIKLTPTGGSTIAERLADAPLFAQLRFSGAADTLWRLTGIEGFDVSGPVAIGADIRGTLNAPVIQGSVRTSAARVENPVTGMILSNVKASGRFDGARLVIDSFAGGAGNGGSVSGSGSFDLASKSGVGMNLTLKADHAVLIARDDLAATVTGPLTLASDGNGGVISGTLELNKSLFRLGRATASGAVPRLNVREINGIANEIAAREPARPWKLALTAKAENRLTVTGLGIDSEWKADLDVGGTVTNPTMRGRADLIRGGYEFAGRRFDLTRGSIRFQGESPPDPIIDIAASGDTQGLNATIRVTGTGQKPDIAFASVPALPQDELLSRLLFGTSITNLSAPEALQLAAAVAALQSGNPGLNPINLLRNAIGLDRLRILPADSVTGQKTSIAVGKYLTRRTYVELITDGQGYSATRIEFQITRWLSLLSSISTIGRQSATVRISKDY